MTTTTEPTGSLPALRPSAHPEYTQRHAIDQLTDIEELRRVTQALYEAFSASREQMDHLFSVHVTGLETCEPCDVALAQCDPVHACEGYKTRHKVIMRGLGLI